MEARDGAAGDGDEDERKQRAAKQWPVANDELRHRRHLQLRVREHDGDGEQGHRAELEEGGEVIARCKQQPHRQDGGNPRIDHDRGGERHRRVVERVAQLRLVVHPTPRHYGQQHQRNAEHRSLEHPSRPPQPQVQADQNRHRDGGGDGRGRPRTVFHGVDDDEAEDR
jgi:hypothetical protein